MEPQLSRSVDAGVVEKSIEFAERGECLSTQTTLTIEELERSDANVKEERPRPENWVSKLFQAIHQLLFPQWNVDDRFKQLRHEHYTDYLRGYPRLAAFMNSDSNFCAYRKFGRLRHRELLYKQQEIMQLQTRLDEMDRRDGDVDKDRLRTAHHKDPERNELMREISMNLNDYDSKIQRMRTWLQMLKPFPRNHRSLLNFIWNKKQVMEDEMEFLNDVDDFRMLADKQSPTLHLLLGKALEKLPLVKHLFIQKSQATGKGDKFVHLLKQEQIDTVIWFTVVLGMVVIIIVPMALLSTLKLTNSMQFTVVSLFILIASLFMWACEQRGSGRIVGAYIAAYAAVLVVFLGNFNR